MSTLGEEIASASYTSDKSGNDYGELDSWPPPDNLEDCYGLISTYFMERDLYMPR